MIEVREVVVRVSSAGNRVVECSCAIGAPVMARVRLALLGGDGLK